MLAISGGPWSVQQLEGWSSYIGLCFCWIAVGALNSPVTRVPSLLSWTLYISLYTKSTAFRVVTIFKILLCTLKFESRSQSRTVCHSQMSAACIKIILYRTFLPLACFLSHGFLHFKKKLWPRCATTSATTSVVVAPVLCN